MRVLCTLSHRYVCVLRLINIFVISFQSIYAGYDCVSVYVRLPGLYKSWSMVAYLDHTFMRLLCALSRQYVCVLRLVNILMTNLQSISVDYDCVSVYMHLPGLYKSWSMVAYLDHPFMRLLCALSRQYVCVLRLVNIFVISFQSIYASYDCVSVYIRLPGLYKSWSMVVYLDHTFMRLLCGLSHRYVCVLRLVNILMINLQSISASYDCVSVYVRLPGLYKS
jgi:hypothetical protein